MPQRSILLVMLIIVALLLLLLDYYVFQGVVALNLTLRQDLRLSINVVYWLISITIVLGLISLLYKFLPGRKLTLLFNTTFNGFFGLFLAKVVFAFFLFGEDVFRIGCFVVSLMTASSGEEAVFRERSAMISLVAGGFALVPLVAFVFGITRGKYHYQVHRKTLYFKDLPKEFDGFTITQISDIHAGSFDSPKAVKRGINLINAQNSDLFVFTGDLVNNIADEIVPWIDLFKQISATYGKLSIVGNHDYGDYISWNSRDAKQRNFEKLKQYHHELGFQLLLNQNKKIYKNGEFINIVGVENWGVGFAQHGNLRQAMEGIEPSSFNILLSHDPSHWDKEVKNNRIKIQLTLSGHTHGMQFGIEIGTYKWSPVKYRYRNWAGVTAENGRYLYVNRGFGFLGFSGRIGIWPEITSITLRKED